MVCSAQSSNLLPLLTVNRVAEILGVRPKTVHALVREGKLVCTPVTARKRRFTEDQVRAFIESRTIAPPKKVDVAVPYPLPSRPLPQQQKGGKHGAEEGKPRRARLREELRSCL